MFFTLKAFGGGTRWSILSVKILESLYAGAFCQFTTGRIGWSGLWTFIRSLMEGAEGFMLMYFHLCSLGIRVGLCLIVVLMWVWNAEVGSEVPVWKFLHTVIYHNINNQLTVESH